MASIGDSRTARRAGIQAEITAVIRPMKLAGDTGAMIEVNCETDFVTKNDMFLNMAAAAAKLGLSLHQIRYRIARLNIATPQGAQVDDAHDDTTAH